MPMILFSQLLLRLLCVKCFQSVNHSLPDLIFSLMCKNPNVWWSLFGNGSLRSIKVSDVCQFYLDGKPLEFVESYSHLGHIIKFKFKFNKQQRAKSHLQVAKTLIKTINIFLIIRKTFKL